MNDREERLLDEISSDFCNFLNRGFHFGSFSGKVDPNLNIEDLQRLLDVHFLLKKDVQEFVRKLPGRLRGIKTSTAKKEEVHEGEVRGRINWPTTIKHRYSEKPASTSTFVCSQPEKNYNIPENLVLKKLLSILYQILHENESFTKPGDIEWFSDWTEDKLLYQNLKQAWLRNIHIGQIDLDGVTVTDRMIYAASQSRKKLYRKAADLLSTYRDLKNHNVDPSTARDVLEDTFIEPDRPEVLFELYWTIQLIKLHRDQPGVENLQFQVVGPGKHLVATWEGPTHEYSIYHDSTGSFTFHETLDTTRSSLDEMRDGFLFRTGKVIERHQQLSQEFFDTNTGDGLWGGRPDIVIETRRKGDDEPCAVFLGEVKYTSNTSYARQGLRELLEYMAYIRSDEETYFESNPNHVLDSDRIKGALFTDDLDLDIDEDRSMSSDAGDVNLVQNADWKTSSELRSLISYLNYP